MIQFGQGPQSATLLLVGSGRLARHLRHYLHLTQTNFLTWSRKENSLSDLPTLLSRAQAVAVAISDSALSEFDRSHLSEFQGVKLHFSGATQLEGWLSVHPLMTFGPELFADDFYPRIHWSVSGLQSIQELFPHWKNPSSILPAEQKALYHAWCVMGGNFPGFLWAEMEKEFQALGIPEASARTYIEAVAKNYLSLGSAAVTGPLVRKDQNTIEKNLRALGTNPWRKIYQAFKEVAYEHS